MENTHYKLPLDISRIFSEGGGYLEQCTELESIDRHIALLLVTHQGEHGFSQQYGTRLWEMDFENIASRAEWEEKFIGYIRSAVTSHEKRLRNVEVSIDVRDTVREDVETKGFSVRKRVDVITLGTVVSTGKRKGFKHVIYLGPLSRD
jgi:phage baseplate assembly protein W